MKSPFPGMDPYLEPSWGDVHTRLVTSSSNVLNKVLPDELIARVEERVAIEANSDDEDDDEPFRLELLDEAPTERSIEIVDAGNNQRLITVIEFLSPANKKRQGIKAFIEKRDNLVSGGVNFVEIDLVREGNWRRLMERYRIPAEGVSQYRAIMHMPGDPPVKLAPISPKNSSGTAAENTQVTANHVRECARC